MPSTTSRRASRSGNGKPTRNARLGSGFAVLAASAGLLATAAPAGAQTPDQLGLLHQGSRGAGVSRVQRALHLRRTGRFDRSTKRAVLGFQRKDALLVDGIVGPQTWDALFQIRPQPAVQTTTGSSSTTAGAPSGGTSSTGGYSVPSGIVKCESGGSYSAVNPQSGAGGAYQIMPSTWQAFGGQGVPQDAPKAEQDHIAAEIYARQGSSAWSC